MSTLDARAEILLHLIKMTTVEQVRTALEQISTVQPFKDLMPEKVDMF